MLERHIRIASEALARTVNRRTFLRHTGTALASGVTALAMGSLLSNSSAKAAVSKSALVPDISCSPPGPYCNTGGGNLSGCHGAHCYQHLAGGQVYQCHVYYQFYPGGCWTTAASGGYWTCCDCQCSNGSTCGCAQFNQTPMTLPE